MNYRTRIQLQSLIVAATKKGIAPLEAFLQVKRELPDYTDWSKLEFDPECCIIHDKVSTRTLEPEHGRAEVAVKI